MNFLLVETAGDEKSELLIRIPQQKSVVILHLLQPTAPFKSRLCVSRSILYFGQTVKKNVKELRTYFSILFSSGRFEQEWTRSRSRSGPLLFSNHRFLGRRWHHHPPVSISCVLLRCCLFCAEFRKDDLQRRWSNSTTTTTTTTTTTMTARPKSEEPAAAGFREMTSLSDIFFHSRRKGVRIGREAWVTWAQNSRHWCKKMLKTF